MTPRNFVRKASPPACDAKFAKYRSVFVALDRTFFVLSSIGGSSKQSIRARAVGEDREVARQKELHHENELEIVGIRGHRSDCMHDA
jgi:hypothetical protein